MNGNILAARTFISHFVSLAISASPSLKSGLAPTPLPINSSTGSSDEVIFTIDQVLNFLQLAVRTCQRAQGAQGTESRKAQEAWIRLCGTYLSKGGVLAQPGVRKVCLPEELVALFHSDVVLSISMKLQPFSSVYRLREISLRTPSEICFRLSLVALHLPVRVHARSRLAQRLLVSTDFVLSMRRGVIIRVLYFWACFEESYHLLSSEQFECEENRDRIPSCFPLCSDK